MTRSFTRIHEPQLLYVFALLVAVAALALLAAPRSAEAAPAMRWVTTSGSDDGGASDCLDSANPCLTVAHALDVAAAGDTIELAGGTYPARLTVTKDITIRGAFCSGMPSPSTILDGQGAGRVVDVSAGVTVRMECLQVTNGKLGNSGGMPTAVGAGIRNAGTLMIVNSVVTDNEIFISDDGLAAGAGIYNDQGILTIVDSTVSLNETQAADMTSFPEALGAGIFNYEGETVVVGSSITGNDAQADGVKTARGGGVFNSGSAVLRLIRSEVQGNDASDGSDGLGGGLYYSGDVVVRNVVLRNNTAGNASQQVRSNTAAGDLEWNHWGNGEAPVSPDDISGTALPATYCTASDCLVTLDVEVDGPGSVTFAHGGDAAFTAALTALATARGDDFEDFVLSYGTNTAPLCVDDCAWDLPLGIDLLLTATPDPGYTFAGWSGAGCGDDMTMDGTVACTATFEAVPIVVEPPLIESLTTSDGLEIAVVNRRLLPLTLDREVTLRTSTLDGASVLVSVPEGALGDSAPAGLRLEIAAVADMAALTEQAPAPPESAFLAQFVVRLTDADGLPVHGEFDEPVTLAFTLPAAALSEGFEAGDTLVLTYWDGEAWAPVAAEVTRNADGSVTLTAEVTHFTVFGVLDAPAWGTFVPGPSASGLTLTRWAGGGFDLLEASLAGGGGVWVWTEGVALGFVLGAPDFVNASFLARYPDGIPAGAPVLVVWH